MSHLDEVNMIIRHVVRRADRSAPLQDAERSDIRAHAHGVDREGVTMAELLRSARPEHPELLRRLVALTAMTYRRGNGTPRSGERSTSPSPSRSNGLSDVPSMAATVAPRSSRGVESVEPELPAHVRAVRDRVRAQNDRAKARLGWGVY